MTPNILANLVALHMKPQPKPTIDVAAIVTRNLDLIGELAAKLNAVTRQRDALQRQLDALATPVAAKPVEATPEPLQARKMGLDEIRRQQAALRGQDQRWIVPEIMVDQPKPKVKRQRKLKAKRIDA